MITTTLAMMTMVIMMMIAASTIASASLFFTGEKAGDIFPSQSDLPLTTCDQCTIYSGREWCPIDFSCHSNASSCGTHCRKQAKLHPSIAALYPQSAGTDDLGGEGEGGSFCVGIQFCFYGSNKCSDCVFGGGTWCPQKRRCYMFDSRPKDNDTLPTASKSQRTLAAAAFINNMNNNGGEDDPVYSSLICQESCQDDEGNAGECIEQDKGCPDCEQFHPSLKCSALLPVLVLSSFGSVGLAVAIAYAGYVLFKRMRAEYHKKQQEKQRLINRKIARARAKAKKRQLLHDQIVQEQDDELAGCSCDDDDEEEHHHHEEENDVLSRDEGEEEDHNCHEQARQDTTNTIQGGGGDDDDASKEGSIN